MLDCKSVLFLLLIVSYTNYRLTVCTPCCILAFASLHFLCFITHNNNLQLQHFYCFSFNKGFPQIRIFIVNLDSTDQCLDIIIKETFP